MSGFQNFIARQNGARWRKVDSVTAASRFHPLLADRLLQESGIPPLQRRESRVLMHGREVGCIAGFVLLQKKSQNSHLLLQLLLIA